MKKITACVFCLLLSMITPVSAQEQLPATPAVSAPVIAAPVTVTEPAPVAADIILTPENPLPVEDYTQYFLKRHAIVKSGDKTADMTYFWFKPVEPWTEGAKFPLILLLHDAAGLTEAARYLINKSQRTEFPAFIVIPALPKDKRWADPGEMGSAHALPETVEIVKQLIAENPAIDPKRIYVMGCGIGGTGAFGAAQLYSDIFAAAIPLAATWSMNESSNMKNVAIAAFHGEDDTVVHFLGSNDTVTMVQREGGTAFFTKIGYLKHDCKAPQFYTNQIWSWLFQQRKK